MPYNPSTGVYTLPAVYLAVPGTVIVATQHNTPLTDLQTANNYERPIIAGGTGANTAGGARTNLGVAAATISVTYSGTSVDNVVPRWNGVSGALQDSALTIADGGDATLESTDAGAAAGPVLTLSRNSATPAAADVIGRLAYSGEDSAGNTEVYAYHEVVIDDPVSTFEDSTWRLVTRTAGANTSPIAAAAGALSAPGGFSVSGIRVGGVPDAVLEDQKASGTDGGGSTSGSWQTRDLNTEVRDVFSIISIAANQFTPTVDGWVEWSAPAVDPNTHQTRLFNVTDTAVVGYGSSERVGVSVTTCTRSVGGGAVVAGKTYRIEHRVQTSNAGDGYGAANSFGGTEVYTRVLFWRTT